MSTGRTTHCGVHLKLAGTGADPVSVGTLVTMPDPSFPEPPAIRPDVDLLANREGDATALQLARVTAERDAVLARVAELEDRHYATGFRRYVLNAAEGIGAAFALTLSLGLVVLVVAGIAYALGWRG